MAVTINGAGTYNVTRPTNADADAVTDWSAVKLEGSGGAPSLLASVGTIDLVAEGTDARAARTNKQRVQIKFTYATGFDFTSGGTGTGATKVPDGSVYIWAAFLAAGSALLKANGGLQISLGDGTNNSYWNVAGSDTYSGGFQKWAINTAIASDEQSTPTGGASTTDAVLGDITEIGFVTDVGGATTRFDNFVVDAFDVGLGLTIQGNNTGTTKLFAESVTQDEINAEGVLSVENGIVFSQGNLEFSGSTQTSESETLVFTDTLGGAYTYQCDWTGTHVLTNSSINASGVVDYNFDTTGATGFTMNGGAVSNFSTLTTASGQTMDGIVFQAGGTSTVANTISNSTFSDCGKITLNGLMTGCTVLDSTVTAGTAAVVCDDLDDYSGGSISTAGTGHAIELTTAADASWTTETTGYDTGATGEPITPTVVGTNATGNETILITDTSATDINIAVSGVTTPSVAVVSGYTGSVNVTGFKPTLTLTNIIADSAANIAGGAESTEIRIYAAGTSTELAGIEDVVETSGGSKIGTFSYQYAYVPATQVDIIIDHTDYQHQRISNVLLGSGDASLPIQQIFDRNYSNPL